MQFKTSFHYTEVKYTTIRCLILRNNLFYMLQGRSFCCDEIACTRIAHKFVIQQDSSVSIVCNDVYFENYKKTKRQCLRLESLMLLYAIHT